METSWLIRFSATYSGQEADTFRKAGKKRAYLVFIPVASWFGRSSFTNGAADGAVFI